MSMLPHFDASPSADQLRSYVRLSLRSLSVSLLLILLVGLPCRAQSDADLTGRDIAERVHDRNIGEDSYAEVTFRVYDESGEEKRYRESVVARMKTEQDLERLYIRFNDPPSVANTAFLTRDNQQGRSDQYLYLPELKRARLIDSGQRGQSFVGTDYTYEDLETRNVADYQHELIGEVACGTNDQYTCWVVRSTFKEGVESQYTRMKRWIAQDALIDVRIRYYNGDSLSKLLVVDDLKKIDGIWTAMNTRLEDREEGGYTRMIIQSIEYNTGLESRIFTPSYLQNSAQ